MTIFLLFSEVSEKFSISYLINSKLKKLKLVIESNNRNKKIINSFEEMIASKKFSFQRYQHYLS